MSKNGVFSVSHCLIAPVRHVYSDSKAVLLSIVAFVFL